MAQLEMKLEVQLVPQIEMQLGLWLWLVLNLQQTVLQEVEPEAGQGV